MLISDPSIIDGLLPPPPQAERQKSKEELAKKPHPDSRGDVASLSEEIDSRREEIAGRKKGKKNLTTDQRADAGALARMEGNAAAVDKYGVSPAAAQAYKHGRTTPGGPMNAELIGAIERRINGAREKAVNHLDSILTGMDEDEFIGLGALDKVKAAQGMANIASKLAPVDKSQERTLIIRVPEGQKTLDSYEVKDVTPEGHVLPSV